MHFQRFLWISGSRDQRRSFVNVYNPSTFDHLNICPRNDRSGPVRKLYFQNPHLTLGLNPDEIGWQRRDLTNPPKQGIADHPDRIAKPDALWMRLGGKATCQCRLGDDDFWTNDPCPDLRGA